MDHYYRGGVCKECGRPERDHRPSEEELDAAYAELAKHLEED